MTKKLTTEEFIKRVKDKYDDEYIILEEYIDYQTPILIRHKCGHEYKVSPNKLLTSNRKCSKCFSKINRTRNTEEYCKEIIELGNNEYTLLEEYINYNTPILIRHKCGHEYKVSPSNFIAGYRCPKCAKGKHESKLENEILYKLKLKYNNIIENDRTILNGKELDIYLPDYNLAIEYNGIYWHSNKFHDKYYHLNKYNICKEKGITLITIWEDEYLNNKDKYFNIIDSFINNKEIEYDYYIENELLYLNKEYENTEEIIYEDITKEYYIYIADTIPILEQHSNKECWNLGYKIYKKIKI